MIETIQTRPTHRAWLPAPAAPAPPAGVAAPLSQALRPFAPISLASMDAVALLNRTDSKYIFAQAQLAAVLPLLAADYRVLEIDGLRVHRYHTLYFDTAGFALYRRHHAGGRNRYKVRSRTYLDTDRSFFELKHKVNQDRTIKRRLPVPHGITALTPAASAFLGDALPFTPAALEPQLWNDFSRITLVNIADQERVTLDVGLRFTGAGRSVALPGVAIAEVKQAGINRGSPFMQAIRRLNIHQSGMSKYCTGAALLYPALPQNNLKPTLSRIQNSMESR